MSITPPKAHNIASDQHVFWMPKFKLEKFHTPNEKYFVNGLIRPDLMPYEVIEEEGNLLVTAGITALLNLLIAAGGTAFNNANAYIGVGDSTTAASVGQTDLQASTNKTRVAMDATYPSVSGAVVTFKSTFGTSSANYAWQEWGIFNASSAGTMLNRRVVSLGTKTSSASWAFTVTITIS